MLAVLGVSKDDVDSHVEFRSKLDLPFSLLADEGGKVRSEWGKPLTRCCHLPVTCKMSCWAHDWAAEVLKPASRTDRIPQASISHVAWVTRICMNHMPLCLEQQKVRVNCVKVCLHVEQ